MLLYAQTYRHIPVLQKQEWLRWMLFTLDNSAENPDEVLVVNLQTPTKFGDAVLSETVPSADAADALEEWLIVIQHNQ